MYLSQTGCREDNCHFNYRIFYRGPIGVNQQKLDGHVKSDKCLLQTFWRL